MTRILKLKDDVILTVERGEGKAKKVFKIRKVASWNMAQVVRLMKRVNNKNAQESLEEIHKILFREQAEESLRTLDFVELSKIITAISEEQIAPFLKKSPKTRKAARSRSAKRR